MREIKFRALGKDGNGWFYGQLFQDQMFINGEPCNEVWIIRDELHQDLVIQEETMGQFTGMKDLNGVDIYEGDILKTAFEHIDLNPYSSGDYDEEGYFLGLVGFRPSQGFIQKRVTKVFDDFSGTNYKKKRHLDLPRIIQSRTTVIGNIHQSAELLEAKS